MRERAWYAYNRGGQVERRIANYPAGPDPNSYDVLQFQYNIDQQLWLVRRFTCQRDAATGQAINVVASLCREYRYDGDGRRRYLVRERDPATMLPQSNRWHEYLGSSIYADLDVNEITGESNAERRYLHAADGQLVGWREGAGGAGATGWHFVHADMLGTMRLVTDANGNVVNAMGFTAFGDVLAQRGGVSPSARSRYGYCGGWGYQCDALEDPALDIGLLHVGARWYEPGTGRFVQRDPLGTHAGANVYPYCYNSPLTLIDPSGLFTLTDVSLACMGNAALGAFGGAAAGLFHPGGLSAWNIVSSALVGGVQGAAGTFGWALGAAAGGGVGFAVSLAGGESWSQIGAATFWGAVGGALAGWGADPAFEAVVFEVFFAAFDANMASNLFNWGLSK